MKNKIVQKKGPFIKDKNSTQKMMFHLLVALLPIILFSVYKNGYIPYEHGKISFLQVFYPLVFILIPTVVSALCEGIWIYVLKKKRGKEFKEEYFSSFSIFPGLFLGLILPIHTPISILILGAIVATVIGKMVYGGFGNNIFNPALVGRLFVISTYALTITNRGGYLNAYEVDSVTGATALSHASLVEGIGSYETLVAPYGSLWNFLWGTIPGAVGETSALLCLIGLGYLLFKKVVKGFIPLTYILTVFVMTFMIGFINDLGIWYPLFQVLSGGLIFGACFMATDPVTSPTTPIGQILYGLFLGILTVIFRYLTPYPEGVLTSILTMNLFVFILDKIGALSRFHIEKAFLPFLIAFLCIFYFSVDIGLSYKNERKEENPDFTIVSKEGSQNTFTYVVEQEGYIGPIKAEIKIQDGVVESIEILEENESFYSKVESAHYIEKLLKNQQELSSLDTVSGATITSTALKKMLIHTLEDFTSSGGVLSSDVPKEEAPSKPQEDYEVLSKDVEGEKTIYLISTEGFMGKIQLEVCFENDWITSIEVVEVNDNYYYKVENADYLTTLLTNQDALEEVDTVSGATYTSRAIKEAIQKTIEDYEENLYAE